MVLATERHGHCLNKPPAEKSQVCEIWRSCRSFHKMIIRNMNTWLTWWIPAIPSVETATTVFLASVCF